MITVRVVVEMRKQGMKKPNAQHNGNQPVGWDMLSSSSVEGPYGCPQGLVWNISSQSNWALGCGPVPVPCFKYLISENSELQLRVAEEIGPARLSDFF
jgi:hypothetical protein